MLNFISTHFEAIVYFNVVWVVCLTAIVIMLKLREVRWLDSIKKFFEGLFFITVVIGQSVLLMMCVYIFWMNYEKRVSIEIDYKILPSTEWVKEKLKVYYIANNDLVSVNVNGTGKKYIYEGQHKVKEYQFSPDGKYILILTYNEIVLLNRKNLVTRTIDSLDLPQDEGYQGKGMIGEARFSPDSQRIVYAKSQWSSISSVDNNYIYDIMKDEKQTIQSPTIKILNLYWDENSENLYFFKSQSLDTQKHAYPFEINVYKVSLNNLTPELVDKIASDSLDPKTAVLNVRGINIVRGKNPLKFSRLYSTKLVWESSIGTKIGLDEDDHLYYVPHRWWKKRLFHLSRDPLEGDIAYYAHDGGLIPVHQLVWLPSGKYAILAHSQFGILILEPKRGKIGQLVDAFGYGFGWYPQNN